VIGFISEKLLIPILVFFYGLVPSYGLAIVALTVVIRIALFPLSAGSIRSARRMKIAQPVMQKRQAEIKSKFSGDPKKQQEEQGKLMKEFGRPLAGCLPFIVQMPVLFALFAALVAIKNKTNSAIKATIERGWKSPGFVAMSETPAKTPKDVRTIPPPT